MEEILFDYLSNYISLTNAEKQAIVGLGIFKSFKKGTILLEQGQLSHEVYFVLKGCIRCYYIIEGQERTTAFYTEMEGLEPVCVNSKKKSEYFVATVEDSILIVGNTDMEAKIFAKFPRFVDLCRIMSEKLLAKSQSLMDEFKLSSPEERYTKILENRPDLVQRVPLNQLASYLGMTPESLSRIRKRLLK